MEAPSPLEIRAENILLGRDREFEFSEGIVRKANPEAMCSIDADEETKREVKEINEEAERGPRIVKPGYALLMPHGDLAEAVLLHVMKYMDEKKHIGASWEDDFDLGMRTIYVTEDFLGGIRENIRGKSRADN